jgi:RNA 3'-terminal phosphate cyclase (ATP)
MPHPLVIDGSHGEGGGQILRTALALSAITGKPFRIVNIRANRPKPGLRRQHRTAVVAAAAVCNAHVTGAEVDSRAVTFEPGPIVPRHFHFDVGSAGSTMLVLQTILPPLMIADQPSTIELIGGTHNVGAPPFPFLQKAFLPLLARFGPRVDLRLDRAGFAPRGGGRAIVRVTPAAKLARVDLLTRGPLRRLLATATIAGLPRDIADRELRTAAGLLDLHPGQLHIDELSADQGPGNLFTIEVESEHVTEVFTAFGQRGVRAEDVARDAATQFQRYLAHGDLGRAVPVPPAFVPAAVGEHLADQLLLPMALAGGGGFTTDALSLHTTTNIDTIRKFLDVPIETIERPGRRRLVRVGGASSSVA